MLHGSIVCLGDRNLVGTQNYRPEVNYIMLIRMLGMPWLEMLTQLVFFCPAVSMVRHADTPAFDFMLLFQAPPLFAGSFAGYFKNTIVPY